MYHWKEKRIQEGWKGKSNQVINIMNFSPGHPPQGASSLLVGMVRWISPFLLETECGLSSTRTGWGRYLDQGSFANMDEALEARDLSFCKSKCGQQYEKIGCQGLHHGRSDTWTDILTFCA